MKKISESYSHEGTDIRFDINYESVDGGKRVAMTPSHVKKTEFNFTYSKFETIRKVGQAFLEIADFVEKL